MRRTAIAPRKLTPFFNIEQAEEGAGGQIDWSRLGLEYEQGIFRVQLNGAALADAETLTVDALPFALKRGDRLQSGADEYITVTDDVAAGETTVPIEPLTTAMEDNDVLYAVKAGYSRGNRHIPAGTVMCRTSDRFLIPRALGTGSGSEVASEFLVSDADENSKNDSKTGYGTIVGGVIYENLCPDAGTNGASAGDLPSGWKTELAANSLGFVYRDWRDSSSE